MLPPPRFLAVKKQFLMVEHVFTCYHPKNHWIGWVGNIAGNHAHQIFIHFPSHIRVFSIFFPWNQPQLKPIFHQYKYIFFFSGPVIWLLETNPSRKRWDGFPKFSPGLWFQGGGRTVYFWSRRATRPVGVLDEGVAPVRSVETRGKPWENCDFIGENGGFTLKKIGLH